jgi:hypothetical protein
MVQPANPDTAQQQTVRNYMALAAAAFQLLTDAEKTAWHNLGLGIDRVDKFGDTYHPSAIQTYQMVNVYRQLDGQAITDTAPALDEQPAIDSVSGSVAGAVLTVSAVHSLAAAGELLLCRVTPPLPSPVRLARENELRFIDSTPADCIVANGATPTSIPMDIDNFTVAAADHIGIMVLTLSSGYLPGQWLFNKSVTLT